jgi:hypothetical protein
MGGQSSKIKEFINNQTEKNFDNLLKELDTNKDKSIDKSEITKYLEKHKNDSEEKIKGINMFLKELERLVEKMDYGNLTELGFDDIKNIFYQKNIILLGNFL